MWLSILNYYTGMDVEVEEREREPWANIILCKAVGWMHSSGLDLVMVKHLVTHFRNLTGQTKLLPITLGIVIIFCLVKSSSGLWIQLCFLCHHRQVNDMNSSANLPSKQVSCSSALYPLPDLVLVALVKMGGNQSVKNMLRSTSLPHT